MAIINTSVQNIKNFFEHSWLDQLFWISFLVLISIISFSLGSLYERHQLSKALPVKISLNQDVVSAWNSFKVDNKKSSKFFASKNGSKVYPLGCRAGDRIKNENKIFFQSAEQAYDIGYERSDRC